MESDSEISSQCEHENQAEVEGYLTCIDCGHVVSESVFECDTQSITFLKSEEPLDNSALDLLNEIYHKDIISKELLDLCILHIKKWSKEKLPLRKYHTCFAIYYCSRMIDFPISLCEISKLFQIPPKKICLLEKFVPRLKQLSPHSFLSKYCAMLKISFHEERKMRELCEIIDRNLNIQPSIAAAVLISIIDGKYSISQISNVSLVTIQTIRKWRKIFTLYLPKNESVLPPTV